MDFLLILLEFLAVSFGILFVVLLFVLFCETVDQISIYCLSKKNKKNNNEKSD